MTWEVLDDILSNTTREYVKFFGGEPLIRCDLIKKAMDKYDKKWSISTNGILYGKLPSEYWNRISDISISFDGFHSYERSSNNVVMKKTIDGILGIVDIVGSNNLTIAITMNEIDNNYHLIDEMIAMNELLGVIKFDINIGIQTPSFSKSRRSSKDANLLVEHLVEEVINAYKYVIENDNKFLFLTKSQIISNSAKNTYCPMLDGTGEFISTDGNAMQCYIADPVGVDVHGYSIEDKMYGCPYVKEVDPHLYDALSIYGGHLDIIESLEDINQHEFFKNNGV